MIAGLICPICKQQPLIIFNSDYKICHCQGLSLLSWKWNTVEDYENIYEANYHDDFQLAKGIGTYIERYDEHLIAAKARFNLYKEILGDIPDICDVGAGNGAFVDISNAVGYDPNVIHPKVLKGGWNIVEGSYDLITLHDVIEHLIDPEACLLYLTTKLKKNGTIIIELPEWDGTDGLRHLKPLEHLFLPNFDAAIAFFTRCNLKLRYYYRPKKGTIGKISYFLQPY